MLNERPEIPENITHAEYFNCLLKDRVNKSPLPKISSFNAIIQFEIIDNGEGIWHFTVEKGFVMEVAVGKHERPTCTFILRSADFLAILKRKVTPQEAFFRGMVIIKGNLLLALRMNVLVNYL